MSPINAHNEWDPLEEIIVGIANDAHFPDDPSFALTVDPKYSVPGHKFTELKLGPIAKQVIDETNEDLDGLVNILQGLGVKVRRPKPHADMHTIKTPYWQTERYFAYCPRDIFLTVGDTIIETPGMQRSRYFESFCYEDIYVDCVNQGGKWIAAPKPKLRDQDFNLCGTQYSILQNREPIFEAANVIRAGRDIIYLVSDGANELGAQWLQNTLGNQYRVNISTDLYSGLHIDSTITLLRPGLFLANPARVTADNIPAPLKNWDMIYAPEMINGEESDIGFISSTWLGMNLLVVNPNLAIVDAQQKELIALLEKNQMEVIPFTLRHGRKLGGGFHCATLDIRRKGQLEDYR